MPRAPRTESLDRSAALIQRLVDAYGGARAWQASQAVTAVASVWGALPLWKFGGPCWRLPITVAVHRPYARIARIDPAHPDRVGVLDGGESRIEDGAGHVLERREHVRASFAAPGRHLLRWDLLERIYFLGYAGWNYLTLPAQLLRKDIEWKKLAPDVLEAVFPEHLPVHGRVQRFMIDPETGLLRRLDYTAEIVGNWARAAHMIDSHENRGGVIWPYERTVFLRDAHDRPRRIAPVIRVRLENCALLPTVPGPASGGR